MLLLHGWPDSPRTWREVASRLTGAGYGRSCRRCAGSRRPGSATRTPRGRGRSSRWRRTRWTCSTGSALTGPRWSGTTGAPGPATRWPRWRRERVSRLVTLSVGYAPGGAGTLPSFEQARLWWYQWFQTLDAGAEAVAGTRSASPACSGTPGARPAGTRRPSSPRPPRRSRHPDFVPTTLHYYRVRWGASPRDPAYDQLEEKLAQVSELSVPTLLIHGGSDTCIAPDQTEDLAGYFAAGYRRVVVPGAGHFVPREAPGTVADLVLDELRAG